MKTMLFPILFVVLISRADAGPSPEARARALVEKAVEAMGGMERLNAPGATFYRIKGKFQNGGNPFEGEIHSQDGGKIRIFLQFKDESNPSIRLVVLDGTKGWWKIDGTTVDMDQDMLTRLKKASHVDRVAGLTALLKNKKFKLAYLGEGKVKGSAVQEIKVTYPEMPDVILSFDKKTGLLLKTLHRDKQNPALGPDVAGKEVVKEMYFENYHALNTSARDEELLKKAGLQTTGPALLAYLQKCIPDDAARKAIQGCIAKLGDNSFKKRRHASMELAKLGIRTASYLRQALKSSDGEVAKRAEQCLTRLRQNKELEQVAAAVRLLGHRQPAGAVPALLDYLPWAGDEATLAEVQDALVAIAQTQKVSATLLEKALKDADPLRRKAAMAALGKDGAAYRNHPRRRLYLDGLRIPLTVLLYRDGKLEMESQSSHYEFFNRFDDAIFLRP